MINKFIYYYNLYQKIIDSYRGDKTDWKEKCNHLKILAQNVSELEVRDCKNKKFYSWLKRALVNEIREELMRVWKLTF